jgi:hypothetical protein
MFPYEPPYAKGSLYFRNQEERMQKLISLLNSLALKYSNTKFDISYFDICQNTNHKISLDNFIDFLIENKKNKGELDFSFNIYKKDITEVWTIRDLTNYKIIVDVRFFNILKNEQKECDYNNEKFNIGFLKKHFQNIAIDTIKVTRTSKHEKFLEITNRKEGYLLGKSIFNILELFEFVYNQKKNEVESSITDVPDSIWNIVDTKNDFEIINESKLSEYTLSLYNNYGFLYFHKFLKEISYSKKLELYFY